MTKLKDPSDFPNIPFSLARKFIEYLINCGYAEQTINIRLGNMNYLFNHYGQTKMLDLLSYNHDQAQKAVDYINNTNPAESTNSMDITAFKLAWESENGIEIIKKRVKRGNPLKES
jgi:hypothetical protein